VSNHGGRQLDSVTATLDALPECVAAAAGRIPVHIDSGIRRGTDIFKALALGADFVWVGRAIIWGLAHSGEDGVLLTINLLREELRTAMALSGCANLRQITSAHLARRDLAGRMCKL
jgi:(S)-2-hydroxy-acid oxidase